MGAGLSKYWKPLVHPHNLWLFCLVWAEIYGCLLIFGQKWAFSCYFVSNHSFSSGQPHIFATATESPVTGPRGNSGVTSQSPAQSHRQQPGWGPGNYSGHQPPAASIQCGDEYGAWCTHSVATVKPGAMHDQQNWLVAGYEIMRPDAKVGHFILYDQCMLF